MAYAIRTRYSLKSAITAKEESTYIPQIYQKTKTGTPCQLPLK
jgi:hypothetical protein